MWGCSRWPLPPIYSVFVFYLGEWTFGATHSHAQELLLALCSEITWWCLRNICTICSVRYWVHARQKKKSTFHAMLPYRPTLGILGIRKKIGAEASYTAPHGCGPGSTGSSAWIAWGSENRPGLRLALCLNAYLLELVSKGGPGFRDIYAFPSWNGHSDNSRESRWDSPRGLESCLICSVFALCGYNLVNVPTEGAGLVPYKYLTDLS